MLSESISFVFIVLKDCLLLFLGLFLSSQRHVVVKLKKCSPLVLGVVASAGGSSLKSDIIGWKAWLDLEL